MLNMILHFLIHLQFKFFFECDNLNNPSNYHFTYIGQL